MAVDMWHSVDKLDGIIGSGCSTVCEPTSLLAAAWGIPVVSWGCSSMRLSNKLAYPTYSRSAGTSLGRLPAIAYVAKKLNWNRTCIISTPEPIYKLQASVLFSIIQEQGHYVELHTVESTVRGKYIIKENMETLTKIFSSLWKRVTYFVLLTYPVDQRNMLISAYDAGMINGDYAFLTSEYGVTTNLGTVQTFRPELDEVIFQGLLALGPLWPSGPTWNEFRQDVIDRLQDSHFDQLPHLPPDANIDQVNNYAGRLFTQALTHALIHLMTHPLTHALIHLVTH